MDLRLKGLVKEVEIDRNNSAYMSEGLAFAWREIFCSSVLPFKHEVELHGRKKVSS